MQGAGIKILATSQETADAFSMVEMTLPPGYPGAPPHHHKELTETFYILEGTVELTKGHEILSATPGQAIIIPPKVTHAFRNASEETARMLQVATPGGHDRFFFELIEWMEREPRWPPKDKAKLIEFGLRHDTYYDS